MKISNKNPRKSTETSGLAEIAFNRDSIADKKRQKGGLYEQCPYYRRYNSILVRETSSALCASSLENFSAVSSSHSLSKAMLHLSLTFLRLVCSEHSIAPPYTVWKRVNFVLTICYSSLSHKKTRMSILF